MIYIIIPVHNRLGYTQDCLESLEKQVYRDFKIIVVDDGSTDGTRHFIQTNFPNVILIEGNGELWWTGATNEGIRLALRQANPDTDFILTLNNDLVVQEDYLLQLIRGYEEMKPCLMGSLSVDVDDKRRIHFAGTRWNRHNAKYRPAADIKLDLNELQKKSPFIESTLLPGRGVLIPIKLFNEIGLYDQKNFPQYMADEDFSLRCKNNGHKLFVSTSAIVYSHIRSTGLSNIHQRKTWKYWIDLVSSRRSPNNLKTRWNWARKHSIVPPFYFLIDYSRIIYSKLTRNL